MQEHEIDENVNKLQKPPPMFMDDVANFPSRLESSKTALTDEKFFCKSMSADTIKVYTNTLDAYR